MRRLSAAAAAALVVAVAGCGDGPIASAPERPPDVLLVLVDALRRDHVGCYGYPKPTTPFLDELGEQGVVFDDALAQAPQTLNSTASLLTSRHFPFLLWGVEHDPIPGVAPEHHEQWAKTPRLAAANLTLAEVLRGGGYETVALFNNPHHHATSGFGQGFETARLLPRDPDTAYARAASLVDAFLEWHAGRDRSRPFFAYLHAMDPHNPYRPTAAARALFPPPAGRHLYANGPPEASFTEADLAHMTALYDAEIRAFDDELRRLVGELEGRDGAGRTVIVVTADHGEELMDHGGLGHGKTVELELLRIPLVLSGGPFAEQAGTRVKPLVRNLDLAPTIVGLAGLPIPADFEGLSLLPLVEGDASVPPAVSFAWVAQLRSLTSAEWHCMRPVGAGRPVLYHRPSDPAGTVDRAAGHPDVAALCEARLERLEAERLESERRARVLKGVETGAEMPPDNADVLEQLRALGYVE
ncbi:MAG TPA: sulfatase [Methylomirabilota bacterium]|nr:sulfatase [Methylomirabilota bacterium]